MLLTSRFVGDCKEHEIFVSRKVFSFRQMTVSYGHAAERTTKAISDSQTTSSFQ